MNITSNVASMISQLNMSRTTDNLTNVFYRLSTGYKINSAADDRVGLSLSEKLISSADSYQTAMDNAKDGINALNIADAGLASMLENIQRIKDLSVQAANGIYSSRERGYLLVEVQERIKDLNKIIDSTKFLEIPLLKDPSTALNVQMGPDSTVSTNTFNIKDSLAGQEINLTALGLKDILSLSGGTWTSAVARDSIGTLDDALSTIVNCRSKLGSMVNRMETSNNTLLLRKESTLSSNSTIRDADIAVETAEMAKLQILQQSTTKVMTQVNQLSTFALSILTSQ